MEAVRIIETWRRKIAFLLAFLLAAAYIMPISQNTAHAEGQSTISFETNYVAVEESVAKVNLKVVRTNGLGTARAFYYANGGGKWLKFAPGETSKTITFPFQDDSAAQGNRMLKVYFATNYIEGASFGTFTSVDVNVLDDDGAPYGPGKLTFDPPLMNTTFKVQESAGYASLIVQRRDGIRGKVSIKYRTRIWGDAIENVDYKPVSGTLVFEDGESWKKIVVPIIDNNGYSVSDKSFIVALSGPGGGATLGFGYLEVRIQNDDPKPTISFVTSHLQVNEDDGYALLDVQRDRPNQNTDVVYAISSGTAHEGTDYKGTVGHSGNIYFPDGESKKTIRIPIIDNKIPEGRETFSVKLYYPGQWGDYNVTSPDNVVIDINDDDTVHFEFKSKTNYAIEESGIALVSVIRSGSIKGRISVNYTTAPVSATDGSSSGSGSDYIKTRGQLTFGDGETVKNIQIPIVDDSIVEYNEKFRLYFEPDWLNENRTVGTFTEVVILDKDRNEK